VHIVTGVEPSSMGVSRVPYAEPIAPSVPRGLPYDAEQTPPSRGHAMTQTGLVYVTMEGLATIVGGRGDPLTGRTLWTREDWLADFGNTMHLMRVAGHDGRILLYRHGMRGNDAVIDLTTSTPQLTRYVWDTAAPFTVDNFPIGHYHSPDTGALTLVLGSTGLPSSSFTATFAQFADESYYPPASGTLDFSWTSKKMILPKQKANNDTGTLASFAVNLGTHGAVMRRLPAKVKCRRWWVTLAAAGGEPRPIVRRVALAESPSELAGV
jgi:hypothetical protein